MIVKKRQCYDLTLEVRNFSRRVSLARKKNHRDPLNFENFTIKLNCI